MVEVIRGSGIMKEIIEEICKDYEDIEGEETG